MNLQWRQTLPALLLGCLLGLWAGVLLPKAARQWRPGAPDTGRMLNKFTTELRLDAGQKDAVKAVIDSYREQVKSIHAREEAPLAGLRAAMQDDIMKLLNPEQQRKFLEMQARWTARRKDAR